VEGKEVGWGYSEREEDRCTTMRETLLLKETTHVDIPFEKQKRAEKTTKIQTNRGKTPPKQNSRMWSRVGFELPTTYFVVSSLNH
jgi:hypothetical protein